MSFIIIIQPHMSFFIQPHMSFMHSHTWCFIYSTVTHAVLYTATNEFYDNYTATHEFNYTATHEFHTHESYIQPQTSFIIIIQPHMSFIYSHTWVLYTATHEFHMTPHMSLIYSHTWVSYRATHAFYVHHCTRLWYAQLNICFMHSSHSYRQHFGAATITEYTDSMIKIIWRPNPMNLNGKLIRHGGQPDATWSS